MEGTEELEEEHYGDRWLCSFSNKPDTDEDAWHGADFKIIPRRVLLPCSLPTAHPAQPAWPHAPHQNTHLAAAKHLVVDQWPWTNLAARMLCSSQSLTFCPSFILSFIFTFLYPVYPEVIFSIAKWIGGLRSNTATRQGDVWVKPENCAW